jgi:hypothetical protein
MKISTKYQEFLLYSTGTGTGIRCLRRKVGGKKIRGKK